MTEPGTSGQQSPDDEQQQTATSDPSHAGGGRTSGETNVDDDLGRGDATAG